MERFKIVNILEEMPVLLCEVEILEDEDENHPEVGGACKLHAWAPMQICW